jgi:hypothetical protein
MATKTKRLKDNERWVSFYRETLESAAQGEPAHNYDMAVLALAARDAYWNAMQRVIAGKGDSDRADMFVEWQHGLIYRDDDWQDVERELVGQIANASPGQIEEYSGYANEFNEGDDHPDIPWLGLGHVEIVFAADGRVSATRIMGIGFGGYEVMYQGDIDDVETVVQQGWKEAFEAMVPLQLAAVGVPNPGVVLWEPWVPQGPERWSLNPLTAAKALESLYVGGITDHEALVLGQLVGVPDVGAVLGDKDMEPDFFAGEWTNVLIKRFGEKTGEDALAAVAPKLWRGIGG